MADRAEACHFGHGVQQNSAASAQQRRQPPGQCHPSSGLHAHARIQITRGDVGRKTTERSGTPKIIRCHKSMSPGKCSTIFTSYRSRKTCLQLQLDRRRNMTLETLGSVERGEDHDGAGDSRCRYDVSWPGWAHVAARKQDAAHGTTLSEVGEANLMNWPTNACAPEPIHRLFRPGPKLPA